MFIVYLRGLKNTLKYYVSILIFLIIPFDTFAYLADVTSVPEILSKDHVSKEEDKFYILLKEVIKTIKNDAIEERSEKELISAAIKGALSILDVHSRYFTPEEFNEIKLQTKGEFGGIGIEVKKEKSVYKINKIIEGSPAERAGLQVGDVIFSIENEAISDSSLVELVEKVKGKAGSKLNLSIERTGKIQQITMVRDTIKINPVLIKEDSNIIYINLPSFTESTAEAIRKKLPNKIKVLKNEVKGIILDLRNNPGGLLEQGIAVADLFLEKGQITTIKGRNKNHIRSYYASNNPLVSTNIPLIVLVNERSASAAEIVAAALHDNGRALLLGTKTFGKGSIQIIIPLGHNMGAMKFTNAYYYTPSGTPILPEGIIPDIEVKLNKESTKSDIMLSAKNDSQLEQAIEVLNQFSSWSKLLIIK